MLGHPFENYLILSSILLLFSIFASKISNKIGVPALILFLGIGMMAGNDGPLGISFDNTEITQYIGVVALIYILFSGGLDTHVHLIRPVLVPGLLLSTLGVLLTCLTIGAFLPLLGNFTFLEGLLLGAIISSTDAAAVFTILRSKGVHLRPNLRALLELESGANDPMAVFLTISLLEIILSGHNLGFNYIPIFFKQMGIGLLSGLCFSFLYSKVINRIKLDFDGLYPVLSLSYVILIYAVTQKIEGSGFLAVYITGLYLGNKKFIHKKSLVLFHDGVAWLMQIIMFLTLGLLVFPLKLPEVAFNGIVISLFLIFIARPAAVFISIYLCQNPLYNLLTPKISIKEQFTLSWIGLRGSVPIILATYPYTANFIKADTFFHLVFFIVISSVMFQGTTIPFITRILKVNVPPQKRYRFPIEYIPREDMKGDLYEFDIPVLSKICHKSIVELDLPTSSLVMLIQRDGKIIVPRGSTQIEGNDHLLVLADKNSLITLSQTFESKPRNIFAVNSEEIFDKAA